jgi:hypothetical protein
MRRHRGKIAAGAGAVPVEKTFRLWAGLPPRGGSRYEIGFRKGP